MTTVLSLPIARLRAAGCRVATVIGHDPKIGDFKYSIRVPDAIGDLREGATTSLSLGYASVSVPRHSDGHHLIVQACAYRRGFKTPADVAADYMRDTAKLLGMVADLIEEYR
jgi:hypothetical protein